VADHDRFPVQRTDDVGDVVGDLAHSLAGEDVGVLAGLRDACRVVGPVDGDGGVAPLLEGPAPGVPAPREKPEPVDEDDALLAGLVGRGHL
jgi:hypothetical protein